MDTAGIFPNRNKLFQTTKSPANNQTSGEEGGQNGRQSVDATPLILQRRGKKKAGG